MDTGTLERALAAAGLRAPVRWDEVTGSTNEVAAAMAAEGAPEWTLVAAGHQTAGRGRLGRTWQDVPGRALMCSLVLRPVALDPRAGGWLPLMAGVALAEAARTISGREVRCKWPNDLLIGDEKVAGVLVESDVVDGRFTVAIVGAGTNLEPPAGVPGATGLGGVDPGSLLAEYLRVAVELYDPTGTRLADAVGARWRALSASLDRQVRAVTRDGREIRGRAVDLDRDGALVLETPSGRVSVASGEVEHLG